MSSSSYKSVPVYSDNSTRMWNNDENRRGGAGAPGGSAGGRSSNTKIEQTQRQVNEVIDVMKDNVNRVLERGDRLADLDERADALQFGAHQFQATAKKVKRKYWWKNLKMWIIIGVIVIVIIAIIAIYFGTSNPATTVAPSVTSPLPVTTVASTPASHAPTG
ncbi:vesicle-associated membrane protein 3-like [Paramacrobiotus metropolitanus]|uniref:vesicle-associated membrane protein 3-like n=1 Tax=Paramacrobiotus metropolitanus TaxID=2943436 RepID=UPI002445EFD2|nr:vesicle-associated membrane protein 3-like [Paramacrobiotus metropolitanus]XP_055345839.1 vesicle-associated membrane protein 3-like [Paramacrobiotus metropolitanus]